MKNKSFIIISLTLFLLSFFPTLSNSDIKKVFSIRPHGEFGSTFINVGANYEKKSNYGYGSGFYIGKILDEWFNINSGLDLSYIRLYNLYSDDLDQTNDYLKILFKSEVNFFLYESNDWLGLNFNLGVGPYIGLSDDNDTHLGMTVGFGFIFKFNDRLQMPLLAQFDYFMIRKEYGVGFISIQLGLNFMFGVD